jgi:hypothetical protein
MHSCVTLFFVSSNQFDRIETEMVWRKVQCIGQPLVLLHIMALAELSATIFKCVKLFSSMRRQQQSHHSTVWLVYLQHISIFLYFVWSPNLINFYLNDCNFNKTAWHF